MASGHGLPTKALDAHGRRDASRALLIAALRPDSSECVRRLAASALDIDWPWVLDRAAVHKVIALLAARVEQAGMSERVGESVAARLQKARLAARQCADKAQETLRVLSKEFAQAGIPFLVVKGSVLAARVYGDPYARRFFDIDIVVRPETVERSEALVRSLGYQLGQAGILLGGRADGVGESHLAEALTEQFYRRFEYELPFNPRSGTQLLAVDLHWHVAPRSRVRLSAHDIWRYSAPFAVADTQVMTFTPSATLIHLAVHATTCSFAGFRLLHLCDVAWAAHRLSAECHDLWTVAEEWGASAHLLAVLAMTERVLGVRLPPELLVAAPPHSQPARPGYSVVARDTFLVDNVKAEGIPQWRRAWMEVVWSVAMGCLGHNLTRSLRVRWTRVRWQWQRRRLASP